MPASKVPVNRKAIRNNDEKSNDESAITIFSQWKANGGWQDTPQSDAAPVGWRRAKLSALGGFLMPGDHRASLCASQRIRVQRGTKAVFLATFLALI